MEHGVKYEPITIQEYEKIIFTQKTTVKVLKTGFVVCLDMPFLGAHQMAELSTLDSSITLDLLK